ncbi:MAG: hypothetical protein LLG06_12530 [Desulfobacteraceae bacterium]|nr:hypothetical protein [Desulfobacteraceae bacterium]
MENNYAGLKDILCAAMDIKEKMKALYEEASGKCSDKIGSETFAVLRDMEDEHLRGLVKMQLELEKENAEFDSCRFFDYTKLSRSDILKRIRREHGTIARACLDDVAAVESGMELENRSIDFFQERLLNASGPKEREFINHLIGEERNHFIILSDLKYYYADPEHWLMEKAKTSLDGAGGVS